MQTNLISRRDLLKAGGALVVSFTFASLPRDLFAQAARPVDSGEVDGLLAIHADGSVTLYTSKVDVGTGIRIALAQMAAEELGVSPSRVSVIEGDTATCPDQGGTGGSTGLVRGGVEIQAAAATARRALLQMGATRLNRPVTDLTIVDGEVKPRAGGTGVGVATLIGDRLFSLKVDRNAPLTPASQHVAIGKPLLRPDLPAKCTGRHVYVQDFTLPNMLHGRIIRPPSVDATLVSIGESSLRGIPDARAVRVGNFLAVVARDEWAAVRAATALKATWNERASLPGHEELVRFSRMAPLERDQEIVSRGNAADVSRRAAKTRTNLSKVFGIPQGKLRIIFLDGSGSYGTNGTDHVAADALLLSKTVGQPVRVQWMRQDEHGWDPKGPQQLLDVRAALDADGRIVAWETEMWVPNAAPGARALLSAEAAGLPQEHGTGSGAITQNGDPPYAVDNVRVVAHLIKDTPLQLSNLRAPGKIANVFAVEGFTDEIAAAQGVDAVDFRLKRLSDPRAIDAITRTAAAFKWDTRPSPNPRAKQGNLLIGRGIAYMRYKQMENYVAMAMEVAVNPSSGQIQVRRVVCSHDCGMVVNPDGLRNQVEGCIVQTLSRALHEEVTFDRSRVTSVDWRTYPILRFPEAPAVDVILIDRPNEPLIGAGEAATAPVAAALANAVFDATGIRLRTVPFTPVRVKEALARA
ncbi:MAG: xanthine dehydrogenase family protein molybdopterin-binding subunit [Acidobacteria bacterium]|nr:MAG: xanthine dehydrogenase family protein molybdopterin-binding subunit [Acidobacteriota bacterium]